MEAPRQTQNPNQKSKGRWMIDPAITREQGVEGRVGEKGREGLCREHRRVVRARFLAYKLGSNPAA